MPHIQVPNGTTLFYDTFGTPDNRPLVLIEGLTAQMIKWRNAFCQQLVDAGFHVIRFDNRDVGLSQKFDGHRYTLTDMAEDTAGLIDALNIGPCHLAGQSMGGMIAQEVALRHPELLTSLTLIYTTASARWFLPDAGNRTILDDQSHLTREQAITEFLAGEVLCQSRDYPPDKAWLRQLAERAYYRDPIKSGNARQAAAVFSAADRDDRVSAITAPTLILAGDADLLIDPRASIELHHRIRGSQLHLFPGMGHELPEQLWPPIIDDLTHNATRPQVHQPSH